MKTAAILLTFIGLTMMMSAKDNAFESLEFDLWMYQVCCMAPQFQFKIEDCNDDAMRELFWNQYFLEGKTPVDALTEEHDR